MHQSTLLQHGTRSVRVPVLITFIAGVGSLIAMVSGAGTTPTATAPTPESQQEHVPDLPSRLLPQATILHTEHISTQQGLSGSLVSEIIQDSRGFMWFGTIDGLDKFDGNHFTVYKPQAGDTNSLAAHHVNLIFEDSFGDLWINAVGEQHRLDRKTGTVSRILGGMWHTAVCEDTSGGSSHAAIWLGTLGNGLHRWDRTTHTISHYRHEPGNAHSLSSDSVLSLCVDGSGTLWIGTMEGLNSFGADRDEMTHYSTGPPGHVHVIAADRSREQSILWVGTDYGLYRYDKATGLFELYRNPFARKANADDNDVRTLFLDSHGTLWVGMVGGIARFDTTLRSFTHFQNDIGAYTWAYLNKSWLFQEDANGILWSLAHGGHSSNPLRTYDVTTGRWVGVRESSGSPLLAYSLCIDNTGTLWLGTLDNGVLKVDASRKPFMTYLADASSPTSPSSPVISGIAEDATGIIWLGSNQGLYRFDPRTESITLFRHDPHNPHSLSVDDIDPVLADRHGGIWLGTRGGGLDLLNPRTGFFQHHRHTDGDTNSLSDNYVTALTETRGGTVWTGTAGGTLHAYDRGRDSFRRHNPRYERFSFSAFIYGLVEAPDGLLWFIFRGAGLVSYSPTTGGAVPHADAPVPYAPPITLSTIPLSTLAIDRRGDLWIGASAGLIRFERVSGKCTATTERDGLASEYVTGIVEDGHGFLWLSTSRGITKYDPRTGKIWNYDAADGIRYGASIRTTGCRTRNGEMYFGGSNGFVRFHPDSIRPNANIPPVVITAFKKFGKDALLDTVISERTSITLPHDENMITFEFAALNYSSTSKNQYAYKLEGFDRDWIAVGNHRSATFTNLDGGTYVFRVRGSNNDGVWNENGTSIVLIIEPPFWKTWWFQSLFFVATLLLVGGIIRYIEISRLRRAMQALEKRRALEEERLRIAGDLHDELASNLSSIATLSGILTDTTAPPHESSERVQILDRISSLSRESVESIRDIIWAIDPRNETLEDLLTRMRDMIAGLCRGRRIQLTFICPPADDLPAANLAPDVRRNLWLLVKEACTNALKHSGCTTMSVDVRHAGGTLHIVIQDDGRGFDPSSIVPGKGLRNMTTRAAQLHGTLEHSSEPGKGTTVRLSIPVAE